MPVEFAREDGAETVRFRVTPAPGAKSGQYYAARGGARGQRDVRPGLPGHRVSAHPAAATWIVAAATTLKLIDVKVAPKLRVGYVMGVGDQVPPAIAQLGAEVELLDADELAWGNLARSTTPS